MLPSQVQTHKAAMPRPLPSKGNLYVRLMAGEVQAQKRKLVGNAALTQRPFMVARAGLPAEHVLKKQPSFRYWRKWAGHWGL